MCVPRQPRGRAAALAAPAGGSGEQSGAGREGDGSGQRPLLPPKKARIQKWEANSGPDVILSPVSFFN